MSYALLLAGDLNQDGELGPKTIRRLDAFLKFQYHGTLVLTGGFIPNYPVQKIPLADQMRSYLANHRFKDTVSKPTKGSLGTYNELRSFFSYVEAERVSEMTIISTHYHIRRIKLLVRKYFGRDIYSKITFVGLSADKPSMREVLVLEPIKYFCLLIPLSWQLKLTQLAHRLGLRFSW